MLYAGVGWTQAICVLLLSYIPRPDHSASEMTTGHYEGHQGWGQVGPAHLEPR